MRAFAYTLSGRLSRPLCAHTCPFAYNASACGVGAYDVSACHSSAHDANARIGMALHPSAFRLRHAYIRIRLSRPLCTHMRDANALLRVNYACPALYNILCCLALFICPQLALRCPSTVTPIPIPILTHVYKHANTGSSITLL